MPLVNGRLFWRDLFPPFCINSSFKVSIFQTTSWQWPVVIYVVVVGIFLDRRQRCSAALVQMKQGQHRHHRRGAVGALCAGRGSIQDRF